MEKVPISEAWKGYCEKISYSNFIKSLVNGKVSHRYAEEIVNNPEKYNRDIIESFRHSFEGHTDIIASINIFKSFKHTNPQFRGYKIS